MNLVEKIKRLKEEKNAVILAHYYQNDEVQDIADYLGDSLKLAQIAMNTTAKIIVFCGVDFMAETAKILNPTKKVLIPVASAGCAMADMLDEKQLKDYKGNHPNTKIITYVNSKATVKALSDCICTSTNALKIIDHYLKNGDDILYCPDQNLGKYAVKKAGVVFDVWAGCCPIHHHLDKMNVIKQKEAHPKALVLVHPECPLEIVEMADYAGSTKQLLDYAINSSADEFIVCTEKGILHAMNKACPNKRFYLASDTLSCKSMKYTTLEDVYKCLKEETNEVFVEEKVAVAAKKALDKMMELSK